MFVSHAFEEATPKLTLSAFSIDWHALFLVSSVAIGAAVFISLTFALGVRLITNAQHAVPGARKGKAVDVRKEIINRVFGYLFFTVAGVSIATLLLGVLWGIDKQHRIDFAAIFGVVIK
jgi:hypothetical protein